MASTTADPGPSRSLRLVGIPLAGLALVAFFIYLGFPYEQLGRRIATEIQRSNGVRVEFRQLSPRLHWLGPGIEANAVRVSLTDGTVFALERVALRPAWSLAWLRGDPAFGIELASAFGSAKGTLILGDSGGYSGTVEAVSVGRLPLAALSELATLDGLLDGEIDFHLEPDGPMGDATLSARNGSLAFAGLPVAIPFETLDATLQFGGEALVAVERLEFAGPMVNGTVTGNVLHAPRLAQAPLRLEANVEAKANVRAAMQSAGIRVDRGGMAKLRITGTVGNPNVR